jgi:dephospho-CoA kinase
VLVIGLTGGIGSGKSTVAALMGERGAAVIDVDGLGRDVIAPGGRAEEPVITEFGDAIRAADGHINRTALAGVVFGNPDALARLTAISHPAINAELAERLAMLATSGARLVVLDMAILVESVLGQGMYTRVVVVEAAVALRVMRAVARGMRREDVEARIASQATDEQRRAVADLVIVNDGDLAALSARLDEAWPTIIAWIGD